MPKSRKKRRSPKRVLALPDLEQRTIAHEYGWSEFQPEKRAVAVIDPKVLEKYVGHYRMASGEVSVVTRKGNQLFERQVGNPAYLLYPENDRDFFRSDWTRVQASVTLLADVDSPSTSLLTRESGKDDEALGRRARKQFELTIEILRPHGPTRFWKR